MRNDIALKTLFRIKSCSISWYSALNHPFSISCTFRSTRCFISSRSSLAHPCSTSWNFRITSCSIFLYSSLTHPFSIICILRKNELLRLLILSVLSYVQHQFYWKSTLMPHFAVAAVDISVVSLSISFFKRCFWFTLKQKTIIPLIGNSDNPD